MSPTWIDRPSARSASIHCDHSLPLIVHWTSCRSSTALSPVRSVPTGVVVCSARASWVRTSSLRGIVFSASFHSGSHCFVVGFYLRR